MKRTTLIILLLVISAVIANAQTRENEVELLSSKLSIHLPTTEAANLFSDNRFIQVGLNGNVTDVNEMLGYFTRFLMNGKVMILRHEWIQITNQVSYYKFYLDPLMDANDFQYMLEMSGFKKFIYNDQEIEIQHFSNTVYSFIKSNSNQ